MVSGIPVRMTTPKIVTTSPNRNGIRQAQAASASGPTAERTNHGRHAGKKNPQHGARGGQAAQETPPAVRGYFRRICQGAGVLASNGKALTKAYHNEQDRREDTDTLVAGRIPMAQLEAPRMVIERTSIILRPNLSPIRPRTRAPTGRARYPMANTANAAMVEATGSCEGKKSGPM